MAQTLNINQEAPVHIPGEIDIQTMQNGYFSAIASEAMKAGQFVKFTAGNTGPRPKVSLAAVGDVQCGMVAYVVKDATYAAGDEVEVAFFGGLVIWQQATAVAIIPGAQVESGADLLSVQASSGQKIRGYALDYFPASGMGRIIQLGILQSA